MRNSKVEQPLVRSCLKALLDSKDGWSYSRLLSGYTGHFPRAGRVLPKRHTVGDAHPAAVTAAE